MRTKIILLTLLTLSGALWAQAEEQHPITVGILTIGGPHRTLANNVTSLLEVNLSSDPRFAVVDRNRLTKVWAEQSLGKSGTVSPETAAKIGQLTGAKILITGRELNPDNNYNIVLIASIIGTETGRVYSHTVHGNRTNLVDLIASLSTKIEQTISEQSTNLIATAVEMPEERLGKVYEKLKGRTQPAVSIHIKESSAEGARQTAQNELGRIFLKAGFTVVDEKSDQNPDINITGDAVAANSGARGELLSAQATLEIKAQERTTGKILALDLEKGVGVDIAKQTAADMAIKNATDKLAERLLPLLAK